MFITFINGVSILDYIIDRLILLDKYFINELITQQSDSASVITSNEYFLMLFII